MRIALAWLVVTACSHPAPHPAKVPSQQIVRAPVSSVPTCADMGPLLRGSIDDDDVERVEGPKKEAVIVASCERDHWPPAVLACAAGATEPTVFECLDQLPSESRARYSKAIEKYAQAGDEDHEVAPPEEITCDGAFAATAVDAWPPAVAVEAERALATKLRGAPLRKLCEDRGWELEMRTCIASTPANGIEDCFVGAGRADVERTVKEADELRAKIVKTAAKPSSITCEKVVAAHYATAKWTGKAPELAGAARTKKIAASKKAMLSSCKGWSLEARACIVADDRDACYALAQTSIAAWGYPVASSKAPPTGIAECDDYGRAIEEIQACSSMAAETKKALADAFAQASAAWATLPIEGREAVKSTCKAAAEATRQAAAGCT